MRIPPAALSLLLLLTACASGPPQVLEREDPLPAVQTEALGPESAEVLRWSYRIGPGDLLRVNVFGHPDLSSEVFRSGSPGTPVDGSGRIQLPLLGELEVAGQTAGEVRRTVEAALSTYLKEPKVDVAVLQHGAHRAFVFGSVLEPGAFVLSRPTTLIELIGQAGGFHAHANRDQVAWLSGAITEENLTLVNATEIDPLLLRDVRPGDLVFVPRRGWADVAEAARDILPVLQSIALPLSLGLQAATLEKID